jgi:hypothetical protein
MSDCYPHVARRRDRIEPAGDCTREEAHKRLRLLRPLLEVLGTKLRRPGLLSEKAIDSIGTLLCPPVNGPMAASNPLAEHFRSLLVDPPTNSTTVYPRVRLQLRTHETIAVEAAEALDTRQRLSCLAVRGTGEMARRLDKQERALSDLTVELDENGTTLVVRQQKNPLRAVVVLTPNAGKGAKPKRNALEATLSENQSRVLADLFEGSGKGRLSQLRAEPLSAVYMPPPPSQSDGSHLLPVWITEHLATIAQDLFRLHVLATAPMPEGKSRLLYFDRASVHRNTNPRYYKGKEHMLVRCGLHAASSACVCGLHGHSCTTPFRLLEFRIELCGASFEQRDGRRCCPRHCGEDIEPQESARFPGVCTRCLKVQLWCCHERKATEPGAKPPPRSDGGLRMDMTGLLQNADDTLTKPPPGAWMLDSVREMAACACAMIKPEHTGSSVIELKADADNAMASLERECHARGHVDAHLGKLDQTCVWLLRRGGGKYCRRVQKMEVNGKRKIPEDPPDVALTHGHLFKMQK